MGLDPIEERQSWASLEIMTELDPIELEGRQREIASKS